MMNSVHTWGINDVKGESTTKAYVTWSSMIQRCYSKVSQARRPTYTECTVCEEWRYFSTFKQWFNVNYVEGYHLDKDIKGGNTYSPETCMFIPKEVNAFLTLRGNRRGRYPIGVYYNKTHKRIMSQISLGTGQQHTIGRFDTVQEAFTAYVVCKRLYAKTLCEKYHLTKDVETMLLSSLNSKLESEANTFNLYIV